MIESHVQSYNKWAEALQSLALGPTPSCTTWQSIANIAEVLQLVSATNNYLFLPEGGGVHFKGASISQEAGCINLHPQDDMSYPYVTKANKLHFIRPGEDPAWSYFVLEAEELQPWFLKPDISYDQEPVIIDAQGDYSDPNTDRDDDGEELYANGVRRLRKGLYLLMNNYSLYNEMDKHNGKHDKWGFEGLQEHMRLLYESFEKKVGNTDYLNFRSDSIN